MPVYSLDNKLDEKLIKTQHFAKHATVQLNIYIFAKHYATVQLNIHIFTKHATAQLNVNIFAKHATVQLNIHIFAKHATVQIISTFLQSICNCAAKYTKLN